MPPASSLVTGWAGCSGSIKIRRTVAFEVGLQNAGMASGLAAGMGKLGTLGLPAAVFSPWMNIAGSILANYWRKRPVEQETEMKNEKLEMNKEVDKLTELTS